MIMMILGIAGCTSLVIAGFGVKDSVSNIVNNQYDQIFQYQISAIFNDVVTDQVQEEIKGQYQKEVKNSALLMETSAEVPYEGGSKTASLLVSEGNDLPKCVNFHWKEHQVNLSQKGEILIDKRLAQVLGVKIGDEVNFN